MVNKSGKKWIIYGIITGLSIATLAGAFVMGNKTQQKNKYEDALSKMNEGQTAKAANIFEELGEYKDSSIIASLLNEKLSAPRWDKLSAERYISDPV